MINFESVLRHGMQSIVFTTVLQKFQDSPNVKLEVYNRDPVHKVLYPLQKALPN